MNTTKPAADLKPNDMLDVGRITNVSVINPNNPRVRVTYVRPDGLRGSFHKKPADLVVVLA